MKMNILKLGFFLFIISGGLLFGTKRAFAAASVYPSKAFPGQQVEIYYGTNDCGKQGITGYVTVDGINAEIISWYDCLGSITIRIPDSARSSNIEVHTKSGFVERPSPFLLLQPPFINSISPEEVIPGESYMTVTGSNFGETFFDNTLYIEYPNGNALEIERANWSDKKIEFVIPSGIAAGKITLRRFDSVAGNSNYVSSNYFYLKPQIDSLDYSAGEVGDTITIYGSYFKSYGDLQMPFASDTKFDYNLEVYFGDEQAQIVSWEWNQIKVVVPQSAQTGNIKVRIFSDKLRKSIEATGPLFKVLTAYADDPFSALQTYLEQTGVDLAWDFSTGSSDVVVAVIDSGIYLNHEDIIGNIWKNPGEIIGNDKDDDGNGYIDDVRGWNFLYDNNVLDLVTDRDDHGTMVSGIIGAINNNGVGISGINKNVSLMPLIIMDGYNFSDPDTVSKAIRYAVDNGADIINLSIGNPGVSGYSAKYDEAIKYAYEHNVLVVAAAGNGDIENNSGINLDQYPVSPVCNDNGSNMVLGVGSLSYEDLSYRAKWSNFGKYVDIWAPGEDILTTSKPTSSNFGNFYYYGDGTSFSAPIVTGIAALVKAKYPEISNTALRDRIIKSAGSGFIVNAYEAIKDPLQEWEKVKASRDAKDDTNNEIVSNTGLVERVKGYILLQVQSVGEAWYVHPDSGKRYYMRDGSVAYQMMRSFGLGITNSDLAKIPSVSDTTEMNASTSVCSYNSLANRLREKILLQVDAHGEAWYIHPKTCRRIYMKDGEAAYQIMRFLGLGITNTDLDDINEGSI